MAIDGRGFGESTKQGERRIAAQHTDDAVAGMKLEVESAFAFLARQPNVDAKRIGIVGASYGSSLALIYGAQNPQVKAVALLSPGTNYFDTLPTEPAVKQYGERSLLLVAAEDDADSASAAHKLNVLARGGKHELKIYGSGGHGTGLFNARVGLEQLLQEFFAENL